MNIPSILYSITLAFIFLIAAYSFWSSRTVKDLFRARGMKVLGVSLVFLAILPLTEIASEIGFGQESLWDAAQASLLTLIVVLNCFFWFGNPLSIMRLPHIKKALNLNQEQVSRIVHVSGSNPESWFCGYCGAKIYRDSVFCNGCGAKVDFR